MTRKDYLILVRVIQHSWATAAMLDPDVRLALQALVANLHVELLHDNPRFNIEQFDNEIYNQ